MQFIVETGEGIVDASSYVTVSEADDYIDFYYSDVTTDWDELTEAEKELHLMRASDFVDNLLAWESRIKEQDQGLLWPRFEFVDAQFRDVPSDVVPKAIKHATIEVALNGLTEDLFSEARPVTSETYGQSSQVYSGPVRVGGNSVVNLLTKKLTRLGYGKRRSGSVSIARG